MPPNPVPYRVVRQKLLRTGFAISSQSGSHVKFTKHVDGRKLTVIVPYTRGDVRVGTMRSILKQAEFTWEAFQEL
ncbi:type II toxin-antitoxin system HicA family toxin [Candidatus Poribacteria bacterium]|nr:type II toxin-antitoxin system HicA family toxin [Candidatus Poribacteria bacterium]